MPIWWSTWKNWHSHSDKAQLVVWISHWRNKTLGDSAGKIFGHGATGQQSVLSINQLADWRCNVFMEKPWFQVCAWWSCHGGERWFHRLAKNTLHLLCKPLSVGSREALYQLKTWPKGLWKLNVRTFLFSPSWAWQNGTLWLIAGANVELGEEKQMQQQALCYSICTSYSTSIHTHTHSLSVSFQFIKHTISCIYTFDRVKGCQYLQSDRWTTISNWTHYRVNCVACRAEKRANECRNVYVLLSVSLCLSTRQSL